MIYKFRQAQKGFTLVELLIVVSVIGLLSGIVIAVINPAKVRERSKDSVRMSSMSKFAAAISAYYSEKGSYPPSNNLGTFNAFVSSYMEPNIVRNVSFWMAFGTQFTMIPDSSDTGDMPYMYFLRNNASGVPTPRLTFGRNRSNAGTASDLSGLCWRPDRNGGRVYEDESWFINCLLTD